MNKLTLTFDKSVILYADLNNYLKDINGINKFKINGENNEIYIEYDDKLISIYLIEMEILLYLKLTKIPSLIAFNKYNKGEEYIINFDNLCCEYCLKSAIDELLITDGIESAYSDFEPISNYKNVKIYVTYDSDIIKKEDIEKIVSKYK